MAANTPDYSTWSPEKLMAEYPKKLTAGLLVCAAEHHSNDELLEQANRFSEKPQKRNSISQNLSNACDMVAMEKDYEPDSWRAAFDIRRGNYLSRRFPRGTGSKAKRMENAKLSVRDPAHPIPADATLEHLKEHSYLRDQDFWIKFKAASEQLGAKEVAERYGTTEQTAKDMIWRAESRGIARRMHGGVPTKVVLKPTKVTEPSDGETTKEHEAEENDFVAAEAGEKHITDAMLAAEGTAHTASSMKTTAKQTRATVEIPRAIPAPKLSRRPVLPLVSDGIRQAATAKRDEIYETPSTILELQHLTGVALPYAESGETYQTVSDFQDFCEDIGKSNLSPDEISIYIGRAIDEWLEKPEKGTFLHKMSRALVEMETLMYVD